MYVGLKQPRGDGERYVTPARAAAMETRALRDSTVQPRSQGPLLLGLSLSPRGPSRRGLWEQGCWLFE